MIETTDPSAIAQFQLRAQAAFRTRIAVEQALEKLPLNCDAEWIGPAQQVFAEQLAIVRRDLEDILHLIGQLGPYG